MTSVGIGVLGGGSFVATKAVLPAIDAADGVHLAAIASRSGPVDPRWASRSVPDYDDVLAHPDVDAVYLPLPNGLHEEWTVKSALAGRHVLCEKPLAPTSRAAARMADACRTHGVLLAEAWMTPFDARWQRVVADLDTGVIGTPNHVTARFTFAIGAEAHANYRWSPDQGGGALLDVGIYVLGLPVTLWGPDVAEVVVSERVVTDDGVDARTHAELTWATGTRAEIRCSFVDPEAQRFAVTGTSGVITVDGDAFTGGDAAIEHRVSAHAGPNDRPVSGPANDPYRAMVEAFGRAVRGDTVWPRPAEESEHMLALIERIAREPVTSVSEPTT